MLFGNEYAIGENYYSDIGTTYYTVDLKKRLHEDCIITLTSFTPENSEEADFLSQIFPDGLSRHGYNYLYNPGPGMDQRDDDSLALLVGLVLELVRKAYYPDKPSRYQSLFACETPEDARQFGLTQAKAGENDTSAPVYEVYTKGKIHRGDMNIINNECSVLELYRRAHIYWSGTTQELHDGYFPLWEYLLPLPAFTAKMIRD